MIKAIKIDGNKEQADYLFKELTEMSNPLDQSVVNLIILNGQYKYLIIRQNDIVLFDREVFFMNYRFIFDENDTKFVECEPHTMEWDFDLNIPVYTKDYINLYGDSARFRAMEPRR